MQKAYHSAGLLVEELSLFFRVRVARSTDILVQSDQAGLLSSGETGASVHRHSKSWYETSVAKN